MKILSSNHVFIKEAEMKSQMKDAQESLASFEEKNQPTNDTYKSVDQDGVRVGPMNDKFLK